MKKFLILFLIMVVTAGFAAAEEDGIGLSLTVEGGAIDVNVKDDVCPYVYAGLDYGTSFLDGALDFGAGIGFEVDFPSGSLPMILYLDFMLGYNLGIGSSSTLSFILTDENELVFDDGVDFSGTLTPGIKYGLGLNRGGNIYFQGNFPIAYTDILAGFDFIFGWESTFGLGLEASAHTIFYNWAEFSGIGFSASYGISIVTIDLGVTIPFKMTNPYSFFDDTNGNGIAIMPGVTFSVLSWLDLYANCAFTRIGGGDGVGINFAVGAVFSF